MLITTRADGEDYTIEIEDSNKVFNFEISVVNHDGKTYIDYTNSNDERYNLLTVENDVISNEAPKLDN